MSRVAVIGAGIAGLTCAYELQKEGCEVTVFERDEWVGGRMATRVKDGLAFDSGVNFFVEHYTQTRALADQLGVKWERMEPGAHLMFKDGGLTSLSTKSFRELLRAPFSLLSKIKFPYMLFRTTLIGKGLDFWDLSSAISRDTTDAYSFAKRTGTKEIADYQVDGFVSTYQFHGADEISLGAMAALTRLMMKQRSKFVLCHTKTGMGDIPNALAKRLTVKYDSPVSEVRCEDDKVSVRSRTRQIFDLVVIATTANHTKKMYKNPSANQVKFLSQVRYSSTINVSFKIKSGALKGLGVMTVPKVESTIISEYTNEETKHVVNNDCSLVNVGLHESFAKKLMGKSDKEIYGIVGKELLRVCPGLNHIKPHDVQRWEEAMPKFYPTYLTAVAEFLKDGQGDKGVFFCGDYLNAPWVEGSIRCGKRVARSVLESLR